jgi:hypothetical protein
MSWFVLILCKECNCLFIEHTVSYKGSYQNKQRGPMIGTNYMLCFFFFLPLGSAVGRQSGCAIQCTDCKNTWLEICVQPVFFRHWCLVSWMYKTEQNDSSYFCATSLYSRSAPQPIECTFLSLLWVPHYHLLPVQITLLFRNHLKRSPRCP